MFEAEPESLQRHRVPCARQIAVYGALKHGHLQAFKLGWNWQYNVETIVRWRFDENACAPRLDASHFKVGQPNLLRPPRAVIPTRYALTEQRKPTPKTFEDL